MTPEFERASSLARDLRTNVDTVVLGKSETIALVISALACGGHVLLEDVPGTAKTILARAIGASIEGASVNRIQCTPDLQPTDVTGLSIWNPQARAFEFQAGPVFANVLLVDEINRALPKAQSALLEAMAERQVTVDGVTRELPEPFFLIATENPIEQEGTFPLPEAQLDRFLLRTSLGYPDAEDEVRILDDQRHGHPLTRLQTVLALDDLAQIVAAVEDVYVDELLKRWIVDLVRATRSLDLVQVGASVRGSLALERTARAWALVHGRSFVSPEDVEQLFVPVIAHRLVLDASLLVDEDLSRDEAAQRVFQACVERAPRPQPEWVPEARAAEA
ncbi:MAG TPA: MoxR family ATPase [Gaiellaceae bacterium]|jgi:MoxR-like ATPase|nr:MoxR family ATPase [Gaiellaceae bacterium]